MDTTFRTKFIIKLAVFDLGETLIFYKGLGLDWSSHYENAIRFAAKNLSIKIEPYVVTESSKTLFKYNTRINPRTKEFDAEIIFKYIFDLMSFNKSMSSQFIEKIFNYFQRDSEPEETAVELLSFLKENNIFTAILTDVPYGMPKYLVTKDLLPISNFIDFVLTSTEAGFRKPSTVGIKLLLNKFDCLPSETIMIGNEEKDIETANSAGVFSILLSKEKTAPDWGQAITIHKLSDLINVF